MAHQDPGHLETELAAPSAGAGSGPGDADEVPASAAHQTGEPSRWSGGSQIVLAATPIGDVGDATANLRALLEGADVVAAEDTRRLRALLQRLELRARGRLVSYHEHNEAERAAELVEAAAAGATVAVVSDAGMPSVSDPGYRVVRRATEAGVRVRALPGPSAAVTALAVSGLASDRFCFEGFAPRKAGERARALAALAAEPRTMVFFESPHRTEATLEAMAEAFGADRPAAVCRELTKTYEEVRRGPLAGLARWAAEGVRGEVTIVVAGAPSRTTTVTDHVAEMLARVVDGERLKAVTAQIAEREGLPRRELYDAALAARDAGAAST